ncbi:MAG: dehydrogenase [Lachnospiraceae bacterium]|nr:dehydrogenase [Lachnospiraceae bacterium]
MPSQVLLILGSLPEFTPLVRLAMERGIRTVVADGNPGTEAKRIADAAADIDVRNTRELAALCHREHVTALTTAYSDLLLECAVMLADAAGIPYHLTGTQLPYYRNKAVMKRTMDRLGIKNGGSAVISENFTRETLRDLKFPMVIKPLDLYGSRGLHVAHSFGEVRAHFAKVRTEFPGTVSLMAEEYNPDPEFNIQTWVHDGEVYVLGICDREKTPVSPGSIPVSTRNVYPSEMTREVMNEAKRVLSLYSSEAGQAEGPLSMQFYYSRERGLSVGEIAARFLGYEHELLETACGISIEELLIAGALGDRDEVSRIIKAARPLGKKTAAVLYFHAVDGILRDQSAAEAVAKREDVSLSELFYAPGERIGAPQSKPYFARFDISADTRGEADRISEEIVSSMTAKDENGKELLIRSKIGSRG